MSSSAKDLNIDADPTATSFSHPSSIPNRDDADIDRSSYMDSAEGHPCAVTNVAEPLFSGVTDDDDPGAMAQASDGGVGGTLHSFATSKGLCDEKAA